MRLYRVSYYDKDHGSMLRWAAHKYQALLRRSDLTDNLDACTIEEIQIPSGKDALVAWLNENFTSDNG